MASRLPHLKEIHGVFIPSFFSTECFESALKFRPKKGDIFIATYPKCGTTWMQNLVINILRKGEPLEKPQDFFLASPFLDQLGSDDSEKLMVKPGAYKTHLPYSKVPWSDKAKYIYVARNPKDCCLSFYHHMKNLPGYQFTNGTLEEFVDLFVKGEVEFNDYFDHLIAWYESRNAPNILLVTFEEMKKDLRSVALKVSHFLDEEYASFLMENPHIFQRILLNCSFEEMKKQINGTLSSFYCKNSDALLSDPNIPRGRKHIIAYNASLPHRKLKEVNFIRCGEVGGWKNYFTAELCEILERRIREKTKNTDVMSLWKADI